MNRPFMNIAHRGFSGRYPENTLIAFEHAIVLGCTWLECDVRLTSDGVPVVIHDATVDRTTDGSGDVSDLAFDDIRQLDAGSWKGARFGGERIPTLDELLELACGRARVVIEFKAPTERTSAIADRVRAADAMELSVASAFEWETILALRSSCPDWSTTWLTSLDGRSVADLVRTCVEAGVDTLGLRARDTDEGAVSLAHDAGLELRCWGVGDDRGPELRRLVAVGADGTTTNHPDALMRILAEPDAGEGSDLHTVDG